MKMTAGQVHDAGVALAQIFNRPRNIPQTAKFKLSRMLNVIEPLANKVERKRYELVQRLGAEKKDDHGKSLGWSVPDEHMEDYRKDWDAIRAEDIGEVKVEPITLTMLGDSPEGLEAHEFKMLGDLVVE